MIPLRDTVPSSSFPVVTLGLIVVNVLVFLHEVSLGPALDHSILQHGFVPARYLYVSETEPWNFSARFMPMLSSMFLHGGWLHLIGNMWTLWIFGDNVEDRLGRGRYLLYYLLSGFAAVYIHYWTGPGSGVPVVGASGAIAGIMGGYFVLFPQARILTILPIFIFIQIVTIPAVVFLAFWFIAQLFNGMVATAARMGGGVAWWAHIGGFVAGALLILPLRKARQKWSFDE